MVKVEVVGNDLLTLLLSVFSHRAVSHLSQGVKQITQVRVCVWRHGAGAGGPIRPYPVSSSWLSNSMDMSTFSNPSGCGQYSVCLIYISIKDFETILHIQ